MKQKKTKANSKSKVGSEILVNVVLDRSGSMSDNRLGTISGYNEYIKGLKSKKETDYSVSLTQFDTPGTSPELTITYVDKPISEIQDLTTDQYEPRGCTPLYDAVGETIRRIEPRSKGRPVLNIIITDGLENASHEFTRESIKALIKKKEAEGWTFVFLGADIDSYSVGQAMGVSAKNIANYTKGNEQVLFAAMATSTANYSSLRCATGSVGQLHAESFFDDSQRSDLVSSSAGTGLHNHPTTTTPTWTVHQPAGVSGSTFRTTWVESKQSGSIPDPQSSGQDASGNS